MNKYSLRKIKTFRGNEGPGLNAELCRNGKPVAFVLDDASGGLTQFQWYDRKTEKKEFSIREYNGNFRMSIGSTEEKLFHEHINSIPPEIFEGETFHITADLFIANLLNLANLKRLCRKKTVIRLKSNGPWKYTVYKKPYAPAFANQLRMEHKDDLLEIFNETIAKQ